MFLQDSRSHTEKLSTFGVQMALNKDVVGPNLRKARERCHMVKTRAASEIGVTERQITRWEKGEVLPRWENIEAAANVYGIDPVELTQDDEGPARDATTLTERIELLEREVSNLAGLIETALTTFLGAEELAAAIDRRREGDGSKPAEDRPRLPGVRPPATRSAQKRSA
jgi:transcriptional regulator with XRE-family HTH domain